MRTGLVYCSTWSTPFRRQAMADAPSREDRLRRAADPAITVKRTDTPPRIAPSTVPSSGPSSHTNTPQSPGASSQTGGQGRSIVESPLLGCSGAIACRYARPAMLSVSSRGQRSGSRSHDLHPSSAWEVVLVNKHPFAMIGEGISIWKEPFR